MSRSCLSRVAGHRNRDVDVDSKASFTLPKSLFFNECSKHFGQIYKIVKNK